MWLVETKGQELLKVAFKDRAARLWCENATPLTGVTWHQVKVPQKEYNKLQQVEFKELAELVEQPPDRLYYHLAQLEQAGLIEIAEYRPLPGGKVERVYRPTEVEAPGDVTTPEELSRFLNAALEATQVDIAAAGAAKEAGERREISLTRATLRLTEAELVALRERLLEIVRQTQEKPGGEGVWTRVVVTLVDLQDRGQPEG